MDIKDLIEELEDIRNIGQMLEISLSISGFCLNVFLALGEC